KVCFDFMAVIVTIELGFRHQVAAEALKNPPKLAFRWRSRDISVGIGLSYCDGNRILASKESRDNGHVYAKLSIIPSGINISDVPRRKSSYSQACIKLSIDDEVNRIAKQLQPIVQPM